MKVLAHIRNKHGIRNVILWGRSMGAATCIFHQSPKYRQKLNHVMPNTSDFIKGMILDSPFTNLPVNIKNFVASKASKLPGFVVDIALNLVEGNWRLIAR